MALTTTGPGTATGSPATPVKVWRVSPSKAEIDPGGYSRRLRQRKVWLGVVTPVVLLALWELASQLQWVDARFFPGPSRIFMAAVDMIASGQWFVDVGITLRTIGTASLVGFLVGVLAGVVMGAFSTVRHLFEPTLSAFYTIPKIALLPLMLLIFGVGDTPGYLLVGLAIFFIAWISTLEAVLTVPTGYREAAEAFGAKGWRAFVHVTLPAILPAVFVSLRISVGQAVLIVIMVEYLMGSQGIGYRIWHSWSLFDADTMYVGVVSVAVLGYLLQLLVKVVGTKLAPWAGSMSGGEK
ncbi:MAG: ABC transporter permease [Microbacterium sp.]|uniref:ABC transporter permease n=1 Tax=Microbacterium sp. TaxID=51671 RepID=UPI00263049CC|nr:ABC transporter permease [Microbacterium sp.]MCX6503008.1 ABC transporter permease [Microbacterium sp.]